MKLGVFADQRLLEDYGFFGVESGGEIVGGDFDGVLGDGAGVGVVAGEGVPVGDEVEAIVGGIVLQADPVFEGAEIVADVQAAGGAHAADDAFVFCCGAFQLVTFRDFVAVTLPKLLRSIRNLSSMIDCSS